MSVVGKLTVRAAWRDGRISGVDVALHRPSVARLLVGQSPATVLKALPRFYVLCARAQQAAAAAALAAAAGRPVPACDAAALWLEFLHECLWRLMLDWPSALGVPPEREAFAHWRRQCQDGGDTAAASRVLRAEFLMPLARNCLAAMGEGVAVGVADEAFHTGRWLDWWRGRRCAMPEISLPETPKAALVARLAAVDQAIAALEGGHDYPLEVAAERQPGTGWAVARVRSARGMLAHAVQLQAEQVVDYRIWAPTDLHFADAGALCTLLGEGAVENRPAAQKMLEQAILALDPCLPFVVEWHDA